MTGPITHWLMHARDQTDLDAAHDAIDRALLLTRRLHHSTHMDRSPRMTGAVVLILPALLAAMWCFHRLVDHLRRSLDK